MTIAFRALVLNLVALDSGTLPGVIGELAHAAFYAAISAVDPDLSAHMHDSSERAAFTLSPLNGYLRSPHDRTIHVNPGQLGTLRICLLDDHLFEVFIQHLLSTALPTIRLGEIRLGITGVLGAPGSDPWVGYATLEDLRDLTATPDHWDLDFASPTAIRWGDADNGVRRVMLFPFPRMAIAGLRTRWDRLAGDTWGTAFEDWVERNVVVGRIWHWETHSFPFQKQTYHGGQGKLEYRVLDSSRSDYVAHLNRLLHFAFFAGIGYKTTHGLGQMRVVS